MKVSLQCLESLLDATLEADWVAETFTQLGFEVESTQTWGELDAGICVGRVSAVQSLPEQPWLHRVVLDTRAASAGVLTGLPKTQLPAPECLVAFAGLGAALPNGDRVEAKTMGGLRSEGLLCSEHLLGIGPEETEVLVISAITASPGTPLTQALSLQDVVFDLSVTPNRPDALGHVGLARELGAMLGKEPKLPAKSTPFGGARGGESTLDIRVTEAGLCSGYFGARVESLRIEPSPFWLRYLLHRLGLRALNNVVDVTNWAMMMWGHPVHAFDADRLEGDCIDVRRAHLGESLKTLDGVERELDPADLVVADVSGPIALAGLMGGEATEVSAHTQAIVLEVGHFDPTTVRRSAKRHALNTEAGYRFERGTDPGALTAVQTSCLALLAECAQGKLRAIASFQRDPEAASKVEPIEYRSAGFASLMGFEVPLKRACSILESLGCRKVAGGSNEAAFVPPTWRVDLNREEDLFEEVLRFVGYDSVPETLPSLKQPTSPEGQRFDRREDLRLAAAVLGLSEVVNYAMGDGEDTFCVTGRPTDSRVHLLNPLSNQRAVLRTSLIPGLLDNAVFAQRHQVDRLAVFEIARVFSSRMNLRADLPEAAPALTLLPPALEEEERLAILLMGPYRRELGDERPMDLWDAKGMVEQLVAITGVRLDSTVLKVGEESGLHPARAIRISADEQAIGFVAEPHPSRLEAYGLATAPAIAEISLDRLYDLSTPKVQRSVIASPPPRYPAIQRDIALVVARDVAAGEVTRLLSDSLGDLCEDVRLFDAFEGEQLGENHKSLAFRMRFRSAGRTLTEAEVDALQHQALSAAKSRFGAVLR